jgi:hypothetical protein
MRRPNSGRFLKKPSASAANNGRIDGASMCEKILNFIGNRTSNPLSLFRLSDSSLHICIYMSVLLTVPEHCNNKHRGLSQRANYTDRWTTAHRRSWCQHFADREVSSRRRGGSLRP